MPESQLDIVLRLIKDSALLKEEKKPVFIEHAKTLNEDDLKKVQTHLESEGDLILNAFEKGIAGSIELDPISPALLEIGNVFKKAKRMISKGKEKDSRNNENPDEILTELNEQ
ncbi:hypothetical protein HOD30_01850 [Candidatus Peregrinibacteria bacterium]|jgi:hypothetical protein|nr:hypothetical protein [Candidatus Peregrinibacteria bacterium]MBT4631761.1 hypothetical protein [Candidatus Peregrinibacteria bacterium]MBT5517272.1 hypothetical protein [Candidatus Peregrinibacteria bacterium]MBT5824514.1 hypothetical protein [Candidatus Peregrinibacteria bacterium]